MTQTGTESQPDLRLGDVVRYRPDKHWCMEGTAIYRPLYRREPDGPAALFDTFWVSEPTLVEPETYEVLFNLNDYDETRDGRKWSRIAPVDRQTYTGQHGLERHLFIRKGATEDRDTILANYRADVEKAEADLRYAQSHLEGCRRVLAEHESADASSSVRSVGVQ